MRSSAPTSITTDLRIAQAMLEEVEPFFDTGIGAAIAHRIAGDVGFDLRLELDRARCLERGCAID